MIGPKKLSEIKAELRAAFSKEGIDLEKWLDEQMAQVQHGPCSDKDLQQTLAMLDNALKRGARRRRAGNGRSRKPATQR